MIISEKQIIDLMKIAREFAGHPYNLYTSHGNDVYKLLETIELQQSKELKEVNNV